MVLKNEKMKFVGSVKNSRVLGSFYTPTGLPQTGACMRGSISPGENMHLRVEPGDETPKQ